jgi:hypothetical protein
MAEPRVRFVIGGVQKAGTTALAGALARHPGIALPDRRPGLDPASGAPPPAWLKEAHVVDAPDFDDAWSVDEVDARFAPRYARFGGDRLHGDATPLSVYHPRVVARIARYNPAMRWIVLLRDPVERAISHYFMERARGNEPRSLLRAILDEPARLAGSFDDFARDAAWRRASYVDRGRYARQLDVLHAHFPREQVLLLRSRDLASSPQATLKRAFAFLGVDDPPGIAAPGRAFEGGYVAPGRWSPARWLLRWSLRGEARRLRDAYGIALDEP